MPSNNIDPLDKAINLRQLQISHEGILSVAMQFEDTEDPAGEDVIDEYQRLTASLYQALEDAQQVIAPAKDATSRAQTVTDQSRQATVDATSAAANANSAAAAANEAASQVENAKGSYATLAARLDATEMGLVENTDPMSLYI